MRQWAKALGGAAGVGALVALLAFWFFEPEANDRSDPLGGSVALADKKGVPASGDTAKAILLGAPASPRQKIVITLSDAATGASVIESLDASLPQLSVKLNDVRVTDGLATGFRIFLALPNATSETPIEHDRYVTSAAFFPLPDGKPENENVGSFVISLTQALAKLVARRTIENDSPLTLTVVPIGDPQAKIGFESSALISR